ncbi:hypothetical protein TanjilG_32587 [Lupinus angustifolius]|uniref:GDSL esterase/lipase n=1 Tax=Lupinus angustifolius TaxID=3871 RepID=A0A4P1R8H1_LUPAN|nr:PREDICTED: GDSL esterase/lipase At2g30310-like [Lupinus angustifolius]OIW04395.1 hypothetical protein TanjilG_32587 [Lupinus angustifolius]
MLPLSFSGSNGTKIWRIVMMHVCTSVVVTSKCIALSSPNFSSILVFGDSTVDSGNNNYILTLGKVNHFPYGKDFPGHVPTGRFSNGKLVTDLLASYLNIKDTVPPFLDPNLSNDQLLTGVCFASGGAGFDDFPLGSLGGGSISMFNQLGLFRVYVTKLKGIVGEDKARQILGDALVVISAGTNDFVNNFYNLPTRRMMFNMDMYQDFLQYKLQVFIKDLYDLGCRKFGISGLPPIGCIPFQITVKHEKDRKCVEDENSDSKLYNLKLTERLPQLQALLPGSRLVYGDIYDPLINLITQPHKYGVEITNRGCCGTGLFEVAPLCTELTPVCNDASKYVFWDSLHASEVTNQYVAKYLEIQGLPQFQI